MIKVIACKIYEYYILQLDQKYNNYDFVFLDIQQHNYPYTLAEKIQNEINKSDRYEKIIILYGLCGNALLKIKANQTPVYVIRVHDCLSVLLGSKERYERLFKNRLSTSWSCYSLKINHCDLYSDYQYQDWSKKYDWETVEYLKEILLNDASVYLTYNYEDDIKYINNQELIKIDLSFLKSILSLKNVNMIELKKGQKIITSSCIKEVFKIKENYND